MTNADLASALEVLDKAGLSPQQFQILHLADTLTPTMTQIAGSSGHSTAAATGIVERMVESGLIQREVVPEDRRMIKISITSTGRAVMSLIEGRLSSL